VLPTSRKSGLQRAETWGRVEDFEMIEAELKFPLSARRLIVETFVKMPGKLRPVSTEMGEDQDDVIIQDQDEFIKNALIRGTGFFLNGPGVSYDINLTGRKDITCNCFFQGGPDLIRSFLVHMTLAKPIFGFACKMEEQERWNRIKTKQGINAIESWVGRDPQKYVPGLYWWTLLPTALAQQHHVSLTARRDVALEHVEIEGGQNLFKFYEKPDDWTSAPRVDALRLSQPGIFDVEKVRPLVAATKTFLELSAVTRAWP
jgi:hypothetical protein